MVCLTRSRKGENTRDEQEGQEVQLHLHLLLLGGLLRRLRNCTKIQSAPELNSRSTIFTLATTFLGLLHGLNDANGNSLPHITDGETAERWVLSVRLYAHWLARDELDDTGITRLDVLRGHFNGLTRSAIDLLKKLSEFTSDVGCMAVKDRCVAGTNLTRVVQDDDLSIK